MTLSVRLAVGVYPNPASARSPGQGEVCGHEVNEVRHSMYVDVLDGAAGEGSRIRIRRSSKRLELQC